MFNLQNKKHSDYSAANLAKLEAPPNDYWDKSRQFESETINDLEKHLWLANGAATTDHVFRNVRDKTFLVLNRTYLIVQ